MSCLRLCFMRYMSVFYMIFMILKVVRYGVMIENFCGIMGMMMCMML